MVVKKDGRAARHNKLEDVPNLHVMMITSECVAALQHLIPPLLERERKEVVPPRPLALLWVGKGQLPF